MKIGKLNTLLTFVKMRATATYWKMCVLLGIVGSNGTGEELTILYINLDDRLDRRQNMDNQLLRSGVEKIDRFPAVLIDENDSSAYQAYLDRGICPYLDEPGHLHRRRGVIGCYISHIQCIETITSAQGATLILEDDILMHNAFISVVKRWIQRMDCEWDVIFFDCKGSWPVGDRIRANLYYPTKSQPYYVGAHAMLVNNRSREKILDILNNGHIGDIDGLLLLNHLAIETYVVRTGLCRTSGSVSNITIKQN